MNTQQQLLLALVLICTQTGVHAAATGAPASGPAASTHSSNASLGNQKAPQNRNLSTQHLLIAGAGALAGTAWWAHNQHKHSKIGHDRYPFMNRRNIVRGLIANEKDPVLKEELQHELAEIEGRLAAIQGRKDRFNAMRILGALVAIVSTGVGIWGLRKKKNE